MHGLHTRILYVSNLNIERLILNYERRGTHTHKYHWSPLRRIKASGIEITRITGSDCAVMGNLINTLKHTATHISTSLGGFMLRLSVHNNFSTTGFDITAVLCRLF